MVIIVGRFNSIVNQRTGLYQELCKNSFDRSNLFQHFYPLNRSHECKLLSPSPFLSLSLLICSDKFLSSIYWKFMGEKLEEFTIPRKDDGSSREITILPVSFSGARGF